MIATLSDKGFNEYRLDMPAPYGRRLTKKIEVDCNYRQYATHLGLYIPGDEGLIGHYFKIHYDRILHVTKDIRMGELWCANCCLINMNGNECTCDNYCKSVFNEETLDRYVPYMPRVKVVNSGLDSIANNIMEDCFNIGGE